MRPETVWLLKVYLFSVVPNTKHIQVTIRKSFPEA